MFSLSIKLADLASLVQLTEKQYYDINERFEYSLPVFEIGPTGQSMNLVKKL